MVSGVALEQMDALFGVSDEEKHALAEDGEKSAATAIEVRESAHQRV
jgi:hypothetical protein